MSVRQAANEFPVFVTGMNDIFDLKSKFEFEAQNLTGIVFVLQDSDRNKQGGQARK